MTHQVYGFSSDFRGVITPGLTPQPLLWEGLDGHLVDHVVGEVLKTDTKMRKPLASSNNCCACAAYLVQVGQAVWVLAQGLILASQSVPGCNLPKLL